VFFLVRVWDVWEGGAKLVFSYSFENQRVYHTLGLGLWTAGDCKGILPVTEEEEEKMKKKKIGVYCFVRDAATLIWL